MPNKEILSTIETLIKNQKKIGVIFNEMILNTPSIRTATNTDMNIVAKDMLKQSHLNQNQLSMDDYSILKKLNILLDYMPLSKILIKTQTNETLFRLDSKKILVLLANVEKSFLIYRNSSILVLSSIYTYVPLIKNPIFEKSFIVNIENLLKLAYRYNCDKNINYEDFYDSRSYFLEKEEMYDLEYEDIVEISEKIVSNILINKQIHTLDLYKLKYFIKRNNA